MSRLNRIPKARFDEDGNIGNSGNRGGNSPKGLPNPPSSPLPPTPKNGGGNKRQALDTTLATETTFETQYSQRRVKIRLERQQNAVVDPEVRDPSNTKSSLGGVSARAWQQRKVKFK